MLSFAFGCTPPRLYDYAAKALAFLCWDVFRLRRHVMERNIGIALGQECRGTQRSFIGRSSYYHFFLTVFEFLAGGKRDICGNINFKGVGHVKQALSQGKGCYIIVAHVGNWEAFGACVSRFIAPAYVAVKNVGSPTVNRFVTDRRVKSGVLLLNRKSPGAAIRQIYEVMKRCEIVGFIMDQRRPGEPLVPFFGIPTQTNAALAGIWQRRPAPVIPGVIHRTAVGRHEVEFFPPLDIPDSYLQKEADAEPAAIYGITLLFNQALEKMIRLYPEQYLWQHNRWKGSTGKASMAPPQ